MAFYIILIGIFILSIVGIYWNRRKKKNIIAEVTKKCKGKFVDQALQKNEDMMMINFWFMAFVFVAAISGVVLLVNIIR